MSYGTLRSIQSLGIVYSCVTRGTTILAFSACCQGNFSEVVPRVLAMIPSRDDRMTYTSGDYMFHYVCEEGAIVLCITDDDFERSRAFLFLEEVKTKFLNTFRDNLHRYTPYSLNSTFGEFLSQKMDEYSEDSYMSMDTGEIRRIRLETINVKDLDVFNESGELEQLELLQSEDSFSMRSIEIEERRIKCRTFCRRHAKIIFLATLMMIITLIIILAVLAIAIGEDTKKR